jgi:putative colanic acid biosynthesis acetyltransferase WcaB
LPGPFFETVQADMRANSGDVKAQSVLLLFRSCQFLMRTREKPRIISWPLVVVYRVFSEFILGIELRPKTVVGAGLSLHHGVGLVVNNGCVIGANVTLRNGVTIGHKFPGGGEPRLGDGVIVGANAVIIGDIVVGRGSVVGAGAVVTKSTPPDSTLVGNPARVLVRGPEDR